MNSKDVIHIHKFKLHNVEIQSAHIHLANDAWIERDPEMGENESPSNIGGIMALAMGQDHEWGLTRWIRELLVSETIIGTQCTAPQLDAEPFEVHDASYIAVALSILSDRWFVAGLEYHTVSNGTPQPQPSAPWTTTFGGLQGVVTINRDDEPELQRVYDFVYSTFCASSHDERKLKLM